MATAETVYLGDLRTEITHIQSQTKIITDAPTDNQGKGEAFSPTDLLAVSLTSCMLTIMGIAARAHGIAFGKVEANTTKIMQANPRKVAEIHVAFHFPKGAIYSEHERILLQKAAVSCPVYLSLHPDIKKDIVFNWADE
ncbi:OsmC family protein [Olivibacter ginsenosidimutans]|uniref:OsmC family protein n=1 Tax=Olivibacter ginsenosidimutans TaxID=1176537 RepID=A0ABP9BQE3_9SPHI